MQTSSTEVIDENFRAQPATRRMMLATAVLGRPPCIVAEILIVMFIGIVAIARGYPPDASLFPTVIGSLGTILCGGFLAFNLVNSTYAQLNISEMEETEGHSWNFWIAFLSSPIYSVSIYFAGFDISTLIAMIVMPRLLGYRGWLRLVVIALGFVVLLHVVFVTAFEIDLPIGLLGDWFLSTFVYED